MLNRSLIAVISNIFTVIISVVAVPLLLQQLGQEDYAILGLYITLQGILLVLEGGLSVTVIEKVATRKISEVNFGNLKLSYLIVSLTVLLISAIYARQTLYSWGNTNFVSISWLIALTLGIRLFSGFSKAQLFGISKHNIVFVSAVPLYGLRFLIPVLLDLTIAQVMLVFLFSVLVELGLYTFVLNKLRNYTAIHSYLPSKDGAYKFASKITLASLVGTTLVQADRLSCSWYYDQQLFGQFQAISTFTLGMFLITGPLGGVFQPVLFRLKSEKYFAELFSVYVFTIIFVAVISFFTFGVFSETIGNIIFTFEEIDLSYLVAHSFYGLALMLYSTVFMYALIFDNLSSYIKSAVSASIIVFIIYGCQDSIDIAIKLSSFFLFFIFTFFNWRFIRRSFTTLIAELIVLAFILYISFSLHISGLIAFGLLSIWLILRIRAILAMYISLTKYV